MVLYATDMFASGAPGPVEHPLLLHARRAVASGEFSDAVVLYTSILAAYPSSDESGIRAAVLEQLGELYTTLGDYPVALDYYLQCLGEYEEAGEYEAVAAVLHSLGVLHGMNGDYDMALDYLQRSRDLFRETGARLMEVRAMRNLGAIHLSRGDLDQALECELRALTVYDALDDQVNTAAAMITIGDIHERRGDPDIAVSFYLRASEILESTEENSLFATALLGSGRIYHQTENTESARFALEQGLAIAEEIGDLQLQYRFNRELSYVLESLGEHGEALKRFRTYAAMRERFVNEERAKAVAELQMRFDLERSLKEEELRRQHDVTRAVVETQEGERRRIAAELHDGIGQLLAALRVNLLRLQGMELSVEGTSAYERSLQLLDKATGDTRAISHSLGSSTLRELGLIAALREVVTDMGSNSDGVQFSFETSGIETTLPEYIELGLFRVAQELIANIVRHSGAESASVQLFCRENVVSLMVEDNGRGFDPRAQREGMGRRNIETRVHVMNGTVRFDSTPGHGTTVTVQIPLSAESTF